MRARLAWVWVLLVLSSGLLFSQDGSNPPALRVDEGKIKVLNASETRLELPVFNNTHQALNARISVELLQFDDKVLSGQDMEASIVPGGQVLNLPCPIPSYSGSLSVVYWWRLRYSIAPASGSDFPVQHFPVQQGIVQLSQVMSQLLRIRVAGRRNVYPGVSFPLRVHVDDPHTGKGQSGVQVEAQWNLGKGNHQQPSAAQRGKTDAHGNAVFLFKVPAGIETDPSIDITAQRGFWVSSKALELSLLDRARVTLSTDKPIYQPGQVLHIRALVFGPDDHALAKSKVKFTVRNEDLDHEFEAEAQTSEFGVAQTEWTIPQKAKLGYYDIRAELDDRAGDGMAQVRISRYELPQFTVDPATDKSFYLPGQVPQLEVKANYLFGQPVKRGTVRIVRDKGRTWNEEKQKNESDQKEVQQGALDNTGSFTAKLDVSEDFEDLRRDDYQRYRDLRFAAYVTDLSTNRTEQRRFTVRLSKDPIHIYVINSGSSTKQHLDGYVTTALPDGTPASVDVNVSVLKPAIDAVPIDVSSAERLQLAHLHTNRYGVGHFHVNPVPSDFLALRDHGSRVQLLLEAAGPGAGKAMHVEQTWLGQSYLTITPAAALLRRGEGVIADLESSMPDQDLFVDLMTDHGVLAWRKVALWHGRAHVEFAYEEKFHNKLTLVAYSPSSGLDDENLLATAEVLFPEPQDLELSVRSLRLTYKPGESAWARFNVRSPDGAPVRSALGVVIYDKAVAERVRTDEEFGKYGFYFEDILWSRYESIAGIGYRDLLNRKLTGPVSPDLELLTRAILATGRGNPNLVVEGQYIGTPDWAFQEKLRKDLQNVQRVLKAWPADVPFPRNLEQLRQALAGNGVSFDDLRDPWGMPYRARFSVSGSSYVVEIVSNGPDKIPDTNDDFVAATYQWVYFTPIGRAIDDVTDEYVRRTGNYIRDLQTLAEELRSRRGVDLEALRDPWGHAYSFRFDVDQETYRINVHSAGPDGIFDSPEHRSEDDIREWSFSVRYFQRETTVLDSALVEHFRKTGNFPTNEEEFHVVWQASGLSPQAMLDPWGRPYHLVFSEASRYSNHFDVKDYSLYGAGPQPVRTAIPVSQRVGYIEVVSFGPKNDPSAGFRVALFTRVLAEQSSKDPAPQKTSAQQIPLSGSTGAISGTVTDPHGAVIVGAKITATDYYTNQQYSATSDAIGVYLLANLPAGKYRIAMYCSGFQTSVIDEVPVTSSNVTVVDASLRVGATAETVEVTAASFAVNTLTLTNAETMHEQRTAKVQTEQQAFTPRVRKYFPETLLWQPEIVTDSSGKAQLKFALADNITTWKMSVIASTTTGKLGVAEKELRTFQPFFLDHEPPKVLTQGDQIRLPVVLRNYLEKPQQVAVRLEQAPWFSLLSSPQQTIQVPAGQDAIARFTISADHPIREGKERVSASNRTTGDAVEHTVHVHPDGEDITQTVAALLSGARNTVEVELPANAIPGSIDAELKIYPNLSAHILDALDAMAVRPAGCAEQITSIALASVLVLELLQKAGQNPNDELVKRAQKYVTDAYQQLLRLQNTRGGFPYWLDQPPDVAVTAHVLDFLAQASPFINVDNSMVKEAEQFLKSTQQQDGGWLRRWHDSAPAMDANLTALVTRVLAETNGKFPDMAKEPGLQQTLSKAMAFLESRIVEWNDPYVVGQYAVAVSMTAGAESIGKTRTLLRRLAHEEGPGTYWNLEANSTPFYSWGSAGRMETTGLAVRALALLPQTSENSEDGRLLDRGLLYLLNHKDRYGSWYSTQATLNVLRGIVAALPVAAETAYRGGAADILVNGKPAAHLHLPASTLLSGPITTEISSLLAPGANKIEIVRHDEGSPLQARVISTHYIPWKDSQATNGSAFKSGESRALRLKVAFDKVQSEAGKSVDCTVEAERIGFAGYGMMLAEIGLPPGADVDRSSLQQAMNDGAISEYDVLPDRVVFYLWPKAGGSKFNFSFRPRFAMKAATTPSILYDYYNPEAQAVVAPVRFEVR